MKDCWRIERRTPKPSQGMRAIRFEDVDEALRLVRRAVEYGCRRHYDSLQRDAVYAGYAGNLFVEATGPFETIVVERQGRIVAFAQIDPSDDRLRAMFVDADQQHRGIGQGLLSYIEALARARGSIRLHGAMALNAVSFYLRAGFRPSPGPERLASARVAIPIVRMEKYLNRLAVASPIASAVH